MNTMELLEVPVRLNFRLLQRNSYVAPIYGTNYIGKLPSS